MVGRERACEVQSSWVPAFLAVSHDSAAASNVGRHASLPGHHRRAWEGHIHLVRAEKASRSGVTDV